MKLVYLGKNLDTTIEHELYSENEFGFGVVVKYDINSWMCKSANEQIIEEYHNVTEVHHLYENSNPIDEIRIAFESDIHENGFNRAVSDIESVEITLSNNLNKYFYDKQ